MYTRHARVASTSLRSDRFQVVLDDLTRLLDTQHGLSAVDETMARATYRNQVGLGIYLALVHGVPEGIQVMDVKPSSRVPEASPIITAQVADFSMVLQA